MKYVIGRIGKATISNNGATINPQLEEWLKREPKRPELSDKYFRIDLVGVMVLAGCEARPAGNSIEITYEGDIADMTKRMAEIIDQGKE